MRFAQRSKIHTRIENKLCLFHDESRYFDGENDEVVFIYKRHAFLSLHFEFMSKYMEKNANLAHKLE